jgi:hypothetical protein
MKERMLMVLGEHRSWQEHGNRFFRLLFVFVPTPWFRQLVVALGQLIANNVRYFTLLKLSSEKFKHLNFSYDSFNYNKL